MAIGPVETDRCVACGGQWFDAGEIEGLLGTKRSVEDYVPHVYREWVDAGTPCPACGAAMRKLPANRVFEFEIDVCPEDRGCWLDGGELERIRNEVESKRLRFKAVDRGVQDEMMRQVAAREVRRVEEKTVLREMMAENHEAPSLAAVSFSELTGAQKLVALLGMPVESGRFCEWRSWVNILLVLANIGIFVFMVMSLSGGFERAMAALAGLGLHPFYERYGFVPKLFAAEPGSYWHTLFSCMFLHGGALHLIGNMFFLFTTGDDIEKRMGHLGYLMFYLAGGVCAGLVSLWAGPAAGVPHIGASGAISAVMGAYMVMCRHKSFYLWIFRFVVFGKMISVSAWMYLLFWFVLQLVNARFGHAGIDYWAHIGGFVFGLVAGALAKSLSSFNPAGKRRQLCAA